MIAKSVAVIGLRHGARHVHGFLNANAEKVYAVDINETLYEDFNDERVEFLRDFNEALSKSDIVVISLPPVLHKEVLQAALKSKATRIFIEKPLLDIGEDTAQLVQDSRVEVIHELRRCEAVRKWNAEEHDLREAWLTWSRPIPSSHTSKSHSIGIVHDLGSHLIDLMFSLTDQVVAPSIIESDIVLTPDSDMQDIRFTLQFSKTLAHIRVASVSDENWPDQEIEVQLRDDVGKHFWTGWKSQHRHLVEGDVPTTQQIKDEKDCYTPALSGDQTYFTPLKIAMLVHKTCNNIVDILKGNNKV